MICPKCRTELIPGAVYCHRCGKKQVTTKRQRRPKQNSNGTGCVFQRGKTWTAQVVVDYRPLPPLDLSNPDNRRQRVPVKRTKGGFPTRKDAMDYLPVLKAGGVCRPAMAPSLDYYWKNYEKNEYTKLSESKQTAYTIAWNRLEKIHGAAVDQLTVADLRDTVSAACASYYTAKDCRQLLSHLFRLAAADGYANKDLPSFIQLPSLTEQPRDPFSDLEQKRLWKLYENGDLRAAIPLLMIYTGMMPGECFDLTVSMIDLPNRMITGAGKKTKVRKQTPVTIAAGIIPVLEDLIAHARPSGRLFGTSEDKWREDYYAALAAAECRRLTPYSCRHTTATALAIDKNIAPQTITKVMRWSTSKMLDRYAHPSAEDAQAAVDALPVGSSVGSTEAAESPALSVVCR